MAPASFPNRPAGSGDPAGAPRRVAELALRGSTGPLRARVHWPPAVAGHRPALLVYLPGDGSPAGRGEIGGAAVLTVSWRPAPGTSSPAAFADACSVMEWAADHAAELDADPARLLVAGDGGGAALAAAIALHARDQGWPPLARQVLIHLTLEPFPSRSAAALRDRSPAGVAPATVVTADPAPPGDEGRRYAARLRRAGVEVRELRHRPAHPYRHLLDAHLEEFGEGARDV